MNGLKCYLAFLINGLAAAYFAWSGMVVWSYALLMMRGRFSGAFLARRGRGSSGSASPNAAVLVIGLGLVFGCCSGGIERL